MHGVGLIIPNPGYDYEHDPGMSQESRGTQDTPWYERLINSVGNVFKPTYSQQPQAPVAAPSSAGMDLLPILAIGAIAFVLLSNRRRR